MLIEQQRTEEQLYRQVTNISTIVLFSICAFLSLFLVLGMLIWGRLFYEEYGWMLPGVFMGGPLALVVFLANRPVHLRGRILLVPYWISGIILVSALLLSCCLTAPPDLIFRSSSAIVLIVPVLLSSFTIRPWASFVTAGGIMIIVVAIVIEAGLIYKVTGDILTMAAAFAIIATITWMVARHLINAVNSLFMLNASLEQRVADRTAELADAKARAEAASRAKSVFLSSMSHELRTPLNAVLGFAQLLERDSNLSARQRESLRTIVTSGEHLLTLINDVLDMSKIEADRLQLHIQACDLHEMLASLGEMFQLAASNKGIRLLVDRGDVPQFVETDPARLRQVLINLVGNAVKFTARGYVAVRAGVAEMNGAQCRLRFEIEDTGPGIAPEDVERIFEPFVQVGAQQSGTGLGLPISRQLVQLMNGTLSVQSEPGQGSTFAFDVLVRLAETATRRETRRRVIGLAPNQHWRILIADDRASNRQLLVEMLSPLGIEVQEVADGRAAVQACQTWSPHIILMDMRMPVLDGREATRFIKSGNKAVSAPVIIALTASAFDDDMPSILAAGCDGIIRKPFRLDDIYQALMEHGVQFIYEEPEQPARQPARAVITTGDLNDLPDQWRARLAQAVTRADAVAVTALLQEIQASHPDIASGLTDMVRVFQFEEILDLLGVA